MTAPLLYFLPTFAHYPLTLHSPTSSPLHAPSQSQRNALRGWNDPPTSSKRRPKRAVYAAPAPITPATFGLMDPVASKPGQGVQHALSCIVMCVYLQDDWMGHLG